MKRFLPSLLFLAFIVSAAIAVDTTKVALGAGAVAHGVAGSVDSLKRGAVSAADSARALERLAADIEKLLSLPEERKDGRVGIAIRSLTREADMFRFNASTPLTPASTTKLVTAYTALCEMGGDHAIKTILAAANRPSHEGTLVGDLYVKGYGDPFLTASDVDLLVDRFMNAGIKRIEGNVVGDGTFFDEKTRRVEYSGDEDQVMPLPPITALAINGNTFTVLVSAPSTPGQPLNVQTVPRSSGFEVVCDAISVGGARVSSPRRGARKKRSDLILPAPGPTSSFDEQPRYGDEPMPEPYLLADADGRKPATKAPAKSPTKAPATSRRSSAARRGNDRPAAKGASRASAPARKEPTAGAPSVPSRGPLKVSVTTGADGRQVVTVTGSLAVGKRASYHYEMKYPAVVVAGMVYDRIRGRGVAITGRVVASGSPTRIKTLAETERPLMEILSNVMKNSNNYLAEYVFKMIGAHAGARSETARASIQRITERMSTSGVSFDRCIVHDGSGLSRANVLSAETLAGILGAAHRDRRVFVPLYAAMSVAAAHGTLRKRLKGTLAEGNVHGKTGTLRNASALTGYVTTRDGELIAFAMLMNGGNHGSYRSVQDKIAARLAAFSYHDN